MQWSTQVEAMDSELNLDKMDFEQQYHLNCKPHDGVLSCVSVVVVVFVVVVAVVVVVVDAKSFSCNDGEGILGSS